MAGAQSFEPKHYGTAQGNYRNLYVSLNLKYWFTVMGCNNFSLLWGRISMLRTG